MGFIYKITNTINNKAYIGITTKTPEERWRAHLNAIKTGKGCPLLRSAVNKHGADKFKIETLIICFDDALFKLEKEYIKKYNTLAPNGYNAHEGGNGGACFTGKKHSQETKNKLREITCRFISNLTDEQKRLYSQRISDGLKKSKKWDNAIKDGRVIWKINMLKRNIKRNPTSKEVKDKISKSVKKYFSESEGSKQISHRKSISTKVSRKIEQYSLDNKLIKIYNSIIEASIETHIGPTNIQSCTSGRTKTAGGYIWKYLTDESIYIKTEEYKQKNREIITKKLGKKIGQYSLDKKIIKIYNSIADASRCTNICYSSIGEVANGKKKTAGGFIWKFENNESKEVTLS